MRRPRVDRLDRAIEEHVHLERKDGKFAQLRAEVDDVLAQHRRGKALLDTHPAKEQQSLAKLLTAIRALERAHKELDAKTADWLTEFPQLKEYVSILGGIADYLERNFIETPARGFRRAPTQQTRHLTIGNLAVIFHRFAVPGELRDPAQRQRDLDDRMYAFIADVLVAAGETKRPLSARRVRMFVPPSWLLTKFADR